MLLAYKILVAALAFMGSLSILVSGELNLLFVLPGLAMIPGYYRYIRGYEPANRWLIAGLAVVELLVMGFDSVFVSGDFFIAVAHMTIIFQALKSFDHREAWDPLQVYFMSMLQVVMASELTLSIAMGGVFVVFLFIFMAALVFSHFLKEGTLERVKLGRPLATISLVALLSTVLFFVSIPRVKGEIWGRRASNAIRTVGFSDNVDFGSFGKILEDTSIVMRVELEGQRLPYYWRGLSLDNFDGIAWNDTMRRKDRVNKEDGRYQIWPDYDDKLTVQKVIIEPLDTEVVFGLGRIVAVEGQAWHIYRSVTGTITMPQKKDRRFTYSVYSAPWEEEYSGSPMKYLQMPDVMKDVSDLARQVAGKGTALQRARRIEEHLRHNYTYSLETDAPPQGVTPVQYFLFNSKKGFCEHYATAMVLMLRSLDIPSRIVTGFLGGDENAYGNYVIVRQRNAHSWVEADIDGKWLRFDPTPLAQLTEAPGTLALMMDSLRMSWYRYVVGFTSRDQLRMLKAFSAPVIELPSLKGLRIKVPAVLIAVLAAALIFLAIWLTLWIRNRSSLSPESRLYLRLKERVRRKGADIGSYSTSHDMLREALRLEMETTGMKEFLRRYEAARFGGKRLGAKELEDLKDLVE